MEVGQILVSVGIAHFAAVVSPGPDFAVVVRNSVAGSRWFGLWTALGISCGVAVHVAVASLGLGVLLLRFPAGSHMLSIAAIAYLAYVGCKGLFQRGGTNATTLELSGVIVGVCSGLRQGFLTSILNPKALAWFATLFAHIGSYDLSAWAYLGLCLELIAISASWFAVLSLLLAAGVVQRHVARYARAVERTTGAILIAVAIAWALALGSR